ncbi:MULTISPECIES: hypothetical protein [Streptomyces]|uniref:DUF2304 domain-containing protein n=1 Tax=Streptomyces rubrogriseus TaxID=194673 RepID=A0A6G3T7H0_9ACTN|nr:hypothetical protein [Streptomyces rubrogriseus]MYS69584.1 hypothetical protein [Streptomyces sp. SID5926]NEC32278.1 hypothetical protein [Streptomyces rubrogriseus]
MIVSVSAVLLLAIVVAVLLRQRTVGIGSALVCGAFGFCLASTGIAPAITEALHALAGVSLH